MSLDLLQQWETCWPACGPGDADSLKLAYRDRWVRFHSLPASKRYPDTEDEYSTLLHRYNTVLDELFADTLVYVVTPDWSGEALPGVRPDDHAHWHPGAEYWTSICTDADPDYPTFTHLYVSRIGWKRGCIDPLLRAVADDSTAGVMVTDFALQRIHHPYDGGADVILASSLERDELRSRHSEWLSAHPEGS